ncbi:MAG: isoleucine--tRNA ligase [Chlamydiota bacterium]|jgi:isoleucyl-tRNA synthetase
MFQVQQDEGFPQREEKIEAFWREQDIFKKSIEQRSQGALFSFYDGPPFATGLPHYGHLLAGTIKDIIPRFKTMKGYFVPRRFGWDCHGLPVENEIEKAKELSGAISIEEFGIANFNEECRSIVLRYTEEWKRTVERMGRWVDFDKTYKTMDTSFMESVWWVFKELWEKGLVYEGFKVMPFSAKLGTPLSNFEANLNYKEVNDPSLTVTFPLASDPNTALLAWTTTPWTLPSNLALAVGPEIDYVKVYSEKHKMHFILAKARLGEYFKEDFSVVQEMKGRDLKNEKYIPLFSYFSGHKNAFVVLTDDFVSTEDGTGIVHTAPAFGEVDFFACKKAGIEIVCPVDNNGRFTDEVPDLKGELVKDADKKIIKTLKEQNRVFHHGQIRHRYPFCWRSDTPLIYKAVSTWFVAVEKIKDQLIEANEKIHWVPGHIKKGRFGKWLENARDWAISRNRYWGTPIPIFRSDDGDIQVVGSVKELEEKTGKKIEDLHRHLIDDLSFEENNKVYKRVSEVFDCWFESGSMPYAQNHYPFENKEETEKGFPADFIAEGLDQTRGWFYTLNVLSVALFNKPAFKNVIVNGIILAEDGTKMSKRLKNYPEPMEVIHKYGADAIRLYMLHSPAVKADDLRFSEKGVELVLRQILIPFWNSFVFLSTYAKIYEWTPSQNPSKPKASIDQWILSKTQELIQKVELSLNNYELNAAVDPFVSFIDQLTNWYIRRSRPRFWTDDDTSDRNEAFQTLYDVLLELSKVAAPFIPFTSEAVFQELRTEKMPLSVHLCDFPVYNEEIRNIPLEKEMDFVQRSVSLGHSLRKEQKIKVRQPLSKVHIASANKEILEALKMQKNLITDELNVKNIELHSDETKFVQRTAKPNFRVLGKKVGKLMPQMQKMVQGFESSQLDLLEQGGTIQVELNGESIDLSPEDIFVERKIAEGIVAANDTDIAVVLETSLTDELKKEGLAREIVNKINTMRRELGFAVTDRVSLKIESSDFVKNTYQEYKKYIDNEVLAVECHFIPNQGTEWDLNGEKAFIEISKVNV